MYILGRMEKNNREDDTAVEPTGMTMMILMMYKWERKRPRYDSFGCFTKL